MKTIRSKMPLWKKILYAFLLFIFLVIGVNVWTWDIPMFLPFIIFIISITMIGFFWNELKGGEDNTDTEQQNYVKNSKKKWIWGGIVLIIFIMVIILVANSPSNSDQGISLKETDKSSDYSEQVGNLYRNTKYNFRIKFPEGWKIEVGDGIHIVQKASFEDSTISVIIQQLDLKGFEEFSSIRDVGTSKEFIDTIIEAVKEKFSDVRIIDYGETKIDNEPTYWVEYSASSQVLDYKLKMRSIVYYLAKGDIMYSINAGTLSDEYLEIKPLFIQSVSTFVLEDY